MDLDSYMGVFLINIIYKEQQVLFKVVKAY